MTHEEKLVWAAAYAQALQNPEILRHPRELAHFAVVSFRADLKAARTLDNAERLTQPALKLVADMGNPDDWT
jgi:hypothetical protein